MNECKQIPVSYCQVGLYMYFVITASTVVQVAPILNIDVCGGGAHGSAAGGGVCICMKYTKVCM